MTAESGLLAGRYRLNHALGHGGMGTVWQATDERLSRDVAVKVLGPQAAADPSAAERFQREARTLATIGHPGVVRIHDFGVDPGPYGGTFLVMELLPGPSLAEVIATNGPLPVADAVRYAMETADALAAAHAAGIVHRDVKPGNLVLDHAGSVRLVDFGIARSEVGEATLTLTGTVMGSAAYLAPELASGQTATPQSDLYALGCILMALLTGHPPFAGDSPVAIVGQHLSATPPDLLDLRPDAPPALAELVAQLLAKDPRSRPARADQVAEHLRSLSVTATDQTAALPTVAGLPPAAAAARPRSRRRRRNRGRATMPLFAGAGVLILLLIVVFSLAGGGDPNDFAVQPPPITTFSPTPPPTTAAPTPTASITPTPTKSIRVDTLATALADLQAKVAGLNQTGPTRKISRELTNQVREITERIDDEEYEEAAKKLADFRKRVGELAENERLSQARADQLRRAARIVAELLPDD